MTAILAALWSAIISSLMSFLSKYITLKSDEAQKASEAQADQATLQGAKTDADKIAAARKLSDDTFAN